MIDIKRLIKAVSTKDINDFLIFHMDYNQLGQKEVINIISENPDCLYSGDAYRILYFWKEDIREAHDQFLKEINEEKIDFKNINYYANNILDKLIRVNGTYQCFAKTINGIFYVDTYLDNPDDGDVKFTLKQKVNGALDIEKLFNKYKDQLSEQTLESYERFKGEEEILAKFESQEFLIADKGNLFDTFQNFYK